MATDPASSSSLRSHLDQGHPLPPLSPSPSASSLPPSDEEPQSRPLDLHVLLSQIAPRPRQTKPWQRSCPSKTHHKIRMALRTEISDLQSRYGLSAVQVALEEITMGERVRLNQLEEEERERETIVDPHGRRPLRKRRLRATPYDRRETSDHYD